MVFFFKVMCKMKCLVFIDNMWKIYFVMKRIVFNLEIVGIIVRLEVEEILKI